MKRIVLLSMLLAVFAATTAWADYTPPDNTLLSNRLFYASVANDAGAKYSDNAGQYYIKFGGGGLNAEHITTSTSVAAGQHTLIPTANNSISGTFYLTDTGGRGYSDEAILMVASTSPFADGFSIDITSSGYTWTYTSDALSETFTAADFIYGPNSYKPGPGSSWTLPFYSGQDTSTGYYLMLVDLYVGFLNNSSLVNNGYVKVDYSIENLYSDIAFNVYGWCLNSNQGQGINWTNDTSSNSYAIDYTGSPVPIPPALLLMGSGLGGIALLRRKWGKRQ